MRQAGCLGSGNHWDTHYLSGAHPAWPLFPQVQRSDGRAAFRGMSLVSPLVEPFPCLSLCPVQSFLLGVQCRAVYQLPGLQPSQSLAAPASLASPCFTSLWSAPCLPLKAGTGLAASITAFNPLPLMVSCPFQTRPHLTQKDA